MVKNKNAFTLLELLISITILGIIVAGLYQALSTAMSGYDTTKEKQYLLAQARYAVERMVMFVQESDTISLPDSVSEVEILKVSERVLDTYNNSSHVYAVDGDGILDADNDADNLVNNNLTTTDPYELITFDLNKTDAGNWKLMEQMPDYSTSVLYDFTAKKEICEHITAFGCKLMAANLVEIRLTLNNGISEVSLKTRARARWIE